MEKINIFKFLKVENSEGNELLCVAGISYSIYKIPQFIFIVTL